MKKVAGTLRLDLATFRELESFAQFGSDLDAATTAKLERGKRTVEVLKQDLNKPLKVERQVAIIYALTKGFLDDIPVHDIVRFENEFNLWLDANDANHKNVLGTIRETKGLPADEDMKSTIEAFKKTFAISEEA